MPTMGATPFVVLLPPSEGKATGGDPRSPWSPESGVFARDLGPYRNDVAGALAKARGGDQKLLGVKGAHLEHAQRQNSALRGSPGMPAWQRYTGVVWDHLDLTTIAAATRKAALKRIFVPSGLAGIVRADDPLPDYRLKMGARLAPFGTMSAWWRDDLTEALARVVESAIVVDLLPQEHKAAIDWTALARVVHVDLVARRGGTVGGHNAKAAKGLLARHLFLDTSATVGARVASFSHPDYSAKAAS